MIYEVITYCDIFGTKFNFYTDEKPKFYTILGGILSILLVFVCVIVFIFYSLDDLKRNTPTVTTSSLPSEGYHQIKFGKENTWIPWRIVDYNNHYIDHKGLIFPIIYYYSRIKKNGTFVSETKRLNYKLCNETSMAKRPDIYNINISLDELYCTEMDEYEVGGSWVSSFIKYIKTDFYFCDEGIDYNETSPKCTKLENITQKIGEKNSLKIEFFYPVVQFQPTNINIPILVIYKQRFYQVSKYSHKIDRFYFHEYVLNDDLGWIYKKNTNSSYLGFSTSNGDSYARTGQKDLMNEGSTSRIYSLNFYLQPGIIYYERKYKKISQIIIEGLPTVFIVFIIFKKIVKNFKFAEGNKKFFELLFENLTAKKDKFSQFKKQIKEKNQNRVNKNNVSAIDNNNLSNIYLKSNQKMITSQLKDSSNVSVLNNPVKDIHNIQNENCCKENEINENHFSPINSKGLKNKRFMSSTNNHKLNFMNLKTAHKPLFSNIIGNSNIAIHTILGYNSIKYQISKLFPYRYYFCLIFAKSFDISKWTCCFSKQFTKAYKFLSQMFDVSSYLILLRQFQILKNIILNVDDVHLIESPQKINVAGRTFLRNMNDCINKGKFDIFAQNISKKQK